MKLLRRLRHESLKCSRSSLHSLIALRFALSLVLSLSLLLCPMKVNYPNRRSRKSFKASFLALSMLSSRFNTSIFVHLLLRSGPLLPYIAKARWICASIHPFLDLSRVFYAGLPEAPQNEDDEVDDIV